jgi:DNA-binding beta-propeller fold protein YncE
MGLTKSFEADTPVLHNVAYSSFFTFVLGLLKPYPEAWRAKSAENKQNISALQRAGTNKLLDLNVLRIIQSYIDTPFYFTSPDIKVEHRIIVANCSHLRYPKHLCELSDGCIAVVESVRGDSLIRIFRGDTLVQSIGRGILSSPFGICTNSSNQLIVTDDGKKQVIILARDGSHIRSFGGQDSDDSQLYRPRGLCVNSIGHILVADSFKDRICVFNNDGKFIRKFGNHDRLSGAIGVCVDNKDNVYVANWDNNSISKFSASGKYLYSFGFGPGRLYYPHDVCVTPDGKYILVADTYNHRVAVISESDGSIIASYGSYGIGNKKFNGAAGCAITSDGRILVSDEDNHQIHEIRKA